jgi:hypothetical protein
MAKHAPKLVCFVAMVNTSLCFINARKKGDRLLANFAFAVLVGKSLINRFWRDAVFSFATVIKSGSFTIRDYPLFSEACNQPCFLCF